MLMYAISCFFTTILSPAYLSQLSKRFFWGEQQTLAVFSPLRGSINLVDHHLEKCFLNEYLVAKIGLDTKENEPSKFDHLAEK